MNLLLRIIGTTVLLVVFAFCGFGFLATFEPLDSPVLPWRIGYGILGTLSLVGIALLLRGRKPAQ